MEGEWQWRVAGQWEWGAEERMRESAPPHLWITASRFASKHHLSG